MKQQTLALGIRDKVYFMGNSDEVHKILCFSDLFLLPSEKESFGLSALEAMASSVPVVSSNVGGLPEVNKQGVSGYLDAVGNIDGMANHAIAILRDLETLNQFKKQASVVAQAFDLHAIVPLYLTLYQETLHHFKR